MENVDNIVHDDNALIKKAKEMVCHFDILVERRLIFNTRQG
jgi:hypothetical protein